MTPIGLVTDAPAGTAAAVLSRLEDAWNRGDGAAFGALYTPDASFATIRGEHHLGREAIAAGHAGIFATIYAGSTNRMQLVEARALGTDIVLAVSRNTLDVPHGPLQGVSDALSTSVLVHRDGEWLVAATHNTLVAGGAR